MKSLFAKLLVVTLTLSTLLLLEIAPAHAQSAVTFSAGSVSVDPGQNVTVDITVEDFTDVTSAQFSLSWDPAVLEFTSTGGYGLPGLSTGSFGTPNALGTPGTLTLAWDDPQAVGQSVPDDSAIFRVTFNAVGSNASQTDLSFSDTPTPRFVYVNFQQADFISQDGTAVLPVELTSFDAAADHRDVLLSWSTATETNNAGFEVQKRRKNESAWQKAAFVEGAGTTTAPQQYQHRLQDLEPGRYVFRLVQTDIDGTRTPHDDQQAEAVVSVENYQLSQMSPAPFRTQAQVTLSVAETQDITVAVYDLLGRQVARLHEGALAADTPRQFTFKGASHASGLYFIRVSGESFQAVRKAMLVR